MLLQATTPRPLLNLDRFPEHVRIYTLRKVGISEGEVLFFVTADIESGEKMTIPLNPLTEVPIEGEPGFMALDYVLPFNRVHEAVGRDTAMALVGAAGFNVTVKSAFRADPRTYLERTMTFSLHMPVTGGGYIRLADSPWDIGNPTLNPKAPMPDGALDPDLSLVFNRVHKLPSNSSEAEKRRAARLAQASASISAENLRKRADSTPALPENASRDTTE